MKKILFFVAIAFSLSTIAQQNATINIVGNARKMITPDKAVFFINVRASRKTEPESYKAMTDISNEVLNRLKKEGFNESQIKLTDYSVQMEYDYSTGKARKTGYVSSQSLIVKFPLDKRKILTAYNNLTANEMEGMNMNFSTECSDTLKNRVQNELIVAALNDAKQKATLIATTTDCKIKSVADVSYKVISQGSFPMPMAERMMVKSMAMDAGNAASDFFSINEVEFSEEIKVTYFIQAFN